MSRYGYGKNDPEGSGDIVEPDGAGCDSFKDFSRDFK